MCLDAGDNLHVAQPPGHVGSYFGVRAAGLRSIKAWLRDATCTCTAAKIAKVGFGPSNRGAQRGGQVNACEIVFAQSRNASFLEEFQYAFGDLKKPNSWRIRILISSNSDQFSMYHRSYLIRSGMDVSPRRPLT
jgi:hypothetical protein